jgi:hypothetical protein
MTAQVSALNESIGPPQQDRNAARQAVDVRALLVALNRELGRQNPPAFVRTYHFAQSSGPQDGGRRILFQAEVGPKRLRADAGPAQFGVLQVQPAVRPELQYATGRGRCWRTT